MDNKYGEYHYKLHKGDKFEGHRLVAVDTEWSKNWKAHERFCPFLITIHVIYLNNLESYCGYNFEIDYLGMETEILFRDDTSSTTEYLKQVDRVLHGYIDNSTTIIGHQLSSDLHTMKQSAACELPTVDYLIDCFRNRKKGNCRAQKVADTRYDIKSRIVNEEKLRTVSLRSGIFAIQNELDKMSLTKMYNEYVIDRDSDKREMLIIMNWRHAFQTCLVWLCDIQNMQGKKPYNAKNNKEYLLTNDIIYEMGKNHFLYLHSDNYLITLTQESIAKYVKKYFPESCYLL